MTTGPETNVELSATFGLGPVTFDRYLQDLGGAGLIRRSGKGGGKAAVHLNDLEFGYVLLSMTAPHPGGAATAVNSLRKLWPEGPPQEGIGSFVTLLAGTVAQLAQELRRGGDPAARIDPGWTLTVSLAPLMAWSTWPAEGSKKRFYLEDPVHPPAPDQWPAICRQTVITKSALMAVARLCADSHERSGVLVEASVPTLSLEGQYA